MYTKLIATSLAAAAIAMPCFADVNASGEVGYIPPFPSAPSVLTRAQVVAELMAALEAQRNAPSAPPPASTLTRAEVIAELLRAQREGTLPPNGEGADIGAVAVRPAVPVETHLAAQ